MRLSNAAGEQPGGPVVVQSPAGGERLRFVGLQLAHATDNVVARVELDWLGQARVSGEGSGDTSERGELRAAADATLRALEAFTGGLLGFDLVGVKSMRGFDADIIMVSVMLGRGGGPQRLVGCHLAEGDRGRAAVMATLHATNRVVAGFIAAQAGPAAE